MKISIIIPVYNVEQYVVQCLQSVADQTWKDGEIECIIVDDCGTDHSMALVEEFISSYSGRIEFKVVRHEKNKGLSAARNTGMDAATGDYLIFIDSDDSITECCLDLMVKQILAHPGVEIVHGNITSVPFKPYYDKVGLKELDYVEGNRQIRALYYDLSINAFDKLLSTSFIRKNNLRFKEGLIHEDELWSYYLYCSAGFISFVHSPTYVHYRRPGSIMTTMDETLDRKSWATILDEVFSNKFESSTSNLEKYFLGRLIEYNDCSPQWQTISKQAVCALTDAGCNILAKIMRVAFDSKDQYYVRWLKVYRNRSNSVQYLTALKHHLLNVSVS